MRVLHITTFLQGGAGRNIVDLAIAQRRAGNDVCVVADAGGEPGYESYPEYIGELSAAAVAYVPLTSTFKRDLALNTNAAVNLRQRTRRWRPDIVHAHAATPAVVARLSGLDGSPVLNTMHGWGIAKTVAQQASDIAVLELADAVVVPSSAAALTLRTAGLKRDVSVIPYGVAPETPLVPADESDRMTIDRVARGRRICVCIGTIGERKNQQLLVEALAADPEADVVAVFIGDGDAEALRVFAHARGVADRIVVLGHRSQASRYLPLAGALVLPSRNEGLPLAVIESLRAGVPVVASDIPEIAEALDGGRCGYLFTPGQAGSLAAALRIALDSPGEQRNRLRERFATHYSSTRMFDAYAELYERLAA